MPIAIPKLLFENLNLRRNPFGELPVEDRWKTAVVDEAKYLDILSTPHVAILFLGDKGHGKTTHLISLMRHFENAAFLHIGEDEKANGVPHGDPVFVDELQRLSWFQRRRLFKRKCRLVLASHRDVQKELSRAGYQVHVFDLGQSLTADNLQTMLNLKIESARRSDGPIPEITLQTAEKMMAQFGGNVREMEWNLYDIFQKLERVTDV